MPIRIPKLDDRDYQSLLKEALARIRVHTPEWTNWNESDPGITLIELFAFLTDSLLYRANQIPERNRRKFLTLLGIPLQPATAATGLVTFANDRGELKAFTLDPDLEVKAGQIPFRTTDGLDLLPVEGRVYYKRRPSTAEAASVKDLYTQLYADPDKAKELSFYVTTRLEPPIDGVSLPALDLAGTVDGAVWVALLARPNEAAANARHAINGKTLTLGFLPFMQAEEKVLPPLRQASGAPTAALRYAVATGEYDANKQPIFQNVTFRASGDPLNQPATVQLQLPASVGNWAIDEPLVAGTGDFPPSLEDTADEERVVTWVRIQVADRGLGARLSWVGINCVPITQRARVASEVVGTGSGEPDQSYTLTNTPVLPSTVKLTVSGEVWSETDDLLAAGPEVPVPDRKAIPGAVALPPRPSKVFTVDRESGEIRFGTGLAGARPPVGSVIRTSYDYGGGTAGNVGIGAINKSTGAPAGVSVTNPLPTWGGDEPESVEEAERLIPRYIQHQNRLVTEADFSDLVKRTPGIDLGRAEVLPLFLPALPDVAVPGVVTLMVIPKSGGTKPGAPEPDRLFLELVCQYLSPRRLVTTELHVRGPIYKGIQVGVAVEVVAGNSFVTVRERVNAHLRSFLSPLTGGREEAGWPLGKPVLAKELWAEASRVEGVAYVKELRLGDSVGHESEEIGITGLELPYLARVETYEGAAPPLVEPTPTEQQLADKKKQVPVPIVPAEC